MEISDFFRFIANDQSANWLTSRAKRPGTCPQAGTLRTRAMVMVIICLKSQDSK